MKNLLAKNAKFDRRVRESVRASRFGSHGLLFWSVSAFALGGLFWFSISAKDFRVFRPFLFLASTFVGPSLVVMAIVDMVRSGWAWSRLFALVFSLCAVALLVAGIYRLIYGYNTA